MLVYNFHYQNVNQKVFYDYLELIKKNKYCYNNLKFETKYLADNKKTINIEILNYLEMDNKFNIQLINNIHDLTPVESILTFYKTIDKCNLIK